MMTKIYDALKQAKRGHQPLVRMPDPERTTEHMPAKVPVVTPPLRSLISIRPVEQIMVGMHQNISLLLKDQKSGMVLQFMGSKSKQGTSKLIREYAKVAANRLGKKVLLIDADVDSPCHAAYFNVEPEFGWNDIVYEGRQIKDAFYRIKESNLTISQMAVDSAPIATLFNSPLLAGIFGELKKEYDLILIDSPSGNSFSETFTLCRNTDGVVLIVESEKTRWQVAANLKEQILKHEGRILGILLNKRRYPIPEFLYKIF
jgi:protein-tyrosine kinase